MNPSPMFPLRAMALSLEIFRPDEHHNSIYDLDFADLRKRGYSVILMDLDETLLPREVISISPLLLMFIEGLKDKGFKIYLLSNSFHPERVEYVAKKLSLPYASLAGKPLPFSFEKALKELETKRKDAIVIGDQLFMDILGGKLAGIYTILVNPMNPENFWLRKIMRWAEKLVLDKLSLTL